MTYTSNMNWVKVIYLGERNLGGVKEIKFYGRNQKLYYGQVMYGTPVKHLHGQRKYRGMSTHDGLELK